MTETTDTAVAELPGDGLREGIVDELRRRIGDALVEHVLKPQDDLWIRVRTDAWEATGRALREMGFEYFCYLSAIDWKPSPWGRGEEDPTQPPPERSTEIKQGYAGGETRFQVLARVTDIRRHVGVTLKVDVPDDDLSIASWHAVYLGANWHERETHEMFGIDFVGHPDLRNMYLPSDFEGYPLRKDFPLLARHVKPWPGIVDVEPMPAEEPEETPAADTATAAADAPAADAPAETSAETATADAPAETPDEPAAEAAAAPDTAAEPAEVTTETTSDAPAPEAPADEATASTEDASAPTEDAQEPAGESAPSPAEEAVPADGVIETVTGTAEEVEAAAETEAAASREADAADTGTDDTADQDQEGEPS